MVDVAEAQRALKGALLLAIGKAEGQALFGRDMDAFWRSFQALIVAIPIFALSVWAEWIWLAADGEQIDASRLAFVRAIHYPVDWLAFPVAMIPLSRLLGASKRYGSYVIALNWTSVVILAALVLPIVLNAVGAVSEQAATWIGLPLLLAALRLRWFIARLALGVDGWSAAGLVFVEFALGLLLARFFDGLI